METLPVDERALGYVVEHYVDTRTRGFALISTRQAVRAIRSIMPRLVMTDRQLGDIVANVAVQRGHGVSFDLDG